MIRLTVENLEELNLTAEEIKIIEAVSPIVSLERTEDGALIIIKDVRGTHQVLIYDGQQGAQGEKGEKGDKGDKGDPGEVTQAEFDELSDTVSDLNRAVELNLNDLRTTNRVYDSMSETVTGSGAYVLREIPIDATQGAYYGSIQSETGGTSGNFLAYLAAYDSSDTRLSQAAFSSTYPATVYLDAPANTVKLKLRLFATLGTSESNKTVTFNNIHILKGSSDVKITLNDNVNIESVAELQNAIFGENKDGTKAFSGTGESNLDVSMDIVSGKSYVIEMTNQDIVGDVQVYGYNGSYTSLIYLTLSETNKFSFEAESNYSVIRFHYIISSVSTTPKSDVEIILKPIYETNNNNIIHIGNGHEYENIQDALDSCADSETNPYIFFIHNGVYDIFSMYDQAQRKRYISLIGESRDGVIVRGNAGTYSKPTAEISTEGVIKNITFIQETSAQTQEPQGSQPYCYAVHDDYFSATTDYENCTFVSNAGPAVGLGLKANKNKAFRNCTFINNGTGEFGSIVLGAFFAHSESANNSKNQELIIENCTAINENGANGLYLSLITTATGATFKGVNIRNVGSFGNGQASAYCTLPLSYSYGNNVEALNVI